MFSLRYSRGSISKVEAKVNLLLPGINFLFMFHLNFIPIKKVQIRAYRRSADANISVKRDLQVGKHTIFDRKFSTRQSITHGIFSTVSERKFSTLQFMTENFRH